MSDYGKCDFTICEFNEDKQCVNEAERQACLDMAEKMRRIESVKRSDEMKGIKRTILICMMFGFMEFLLCIPRVLGWNFVDEILGDCAMILIMVSISFRFSEWILRKED